MSHQCHADMRVTTDQDGGLVLVLVWRYQGGQCGANILFSHSNSESSANKPLTACSCSWPNIAAGGGSHDGSPMVHMLGLPAVVMFNSSLARLPLRL